MTAGQRVKIRGDAHPGVTGEEFLCLKAHHRYGRQAYGTSADAAEVTYEGRYHFMPVSSPLRPERCTPVPVIHGLTDAGAMARMQVEVKSSEPVSLGIVPLGTVQIDVPILERTFLGGNAMRVGIAPPPDANSGNCLARFYATFPKSSGGEFEAHIRPRWRNV